MDKNRIIEELYSAIDEFNEQQLDETPLEKSPEKTLFGKGGSLNSLGLVNLIVIIEEKIEDAFDLPIILADEKAMSQKKSPFRNINALADYINLLLEEDNG